MKQKTLFTTFIIFFLNVGYVTADSHATYKEYQNMRFGFQVWYPEGLLIPQGESDNGDGQKFQSKNRAVSMLVYGGHSFEATVESKFREDTISITGGHSVRQVTYKHKGDNWYVVSGFSEEKVFYQKTIIVDGTIMTFYITYPSTKKKVWDPITATISKSFKNLKREVAFVERKSEDSLIEKSVNYKRLALVIGNSKYYYGGYLRNPANDARSIKIVLENLDFVVSKYEDINQKTMKRAIDEFGKKLKNYDIGLFFYAGHGVQVKGNNYLIPIDAKLENENDVEYDAVRADRVLAKMESAGTKTNIVILDACRDNPFESSWRRGAGGNGLAFMDAPSGSIIAYATSPRNTASDGNGINGLYTSAILEHIQTPNITIEQMFKRVRSTTMEWSDGKQIPWESTSLRGNFYFTVESMPFP